MFSQKGFEGEEAGEANTVLQVSQTCSGYLKKGVGITVGGEKNNTKL